MTLRLIFKQSIKDFWNKKGLYASFTIFLSVALAFMIGLFSFISIFSSNVAGINNSGIYNAKFGSFQFATKVDKKEDHIFYDVEDGMYNYFYNIVSSKYDVKNEKTKENLEKLIVDLINQIGLNFGNFDKKGISQREDGKQLTELWNNYLDVQNEGPYSLAFSNNLLFNYLESKFNKEYGYSMMGVNVLESNDYSFDDKGNKIAYKSTPFLRKNVSEKEWNNIPLNFRANKYTDLKIYNELKRSELNEHQKELFDAGNYTYVEPRYINETNQKIGDIVKTTLYDTGKTEAELLILGTALNKQGILHHSSGYSFFINPTAIKNFKMAKTFNTSEVFFIDTKTKSNLIAQQKFLDKINKLFVSKDLNEVISFELGNVTYRQQTAQQSVIIFSIICYGLGALLILLVMVVFYFITEQFIKMQKQTLFFLKSIGERNKILALLTTLSMFVPLVISLTIGIFGSILVSDILVTAISTEYAFVWSRFLFSWKLVIGLVLLIALLLGFFFATNALIIHGKSLTFTGLNSSKSPGKAWRMISSKIRFLSSKRRIGISFVMKNMYKNIVTFLILTTTFTTILFAVQFSASANYSATISAKHNAPYKSVKFNSTITPYSKLNYKEDALKNGLLYSYERVSKISDLKKIDNLEEFLELIFKSIIGEEDISQYYMSYNLIKQLAATNQGVAEIDDKELDEKILSFIAKINDEELKELVYEEYEENKADIFTMRKHFHDQFKEIISQLNSVNSVQNANPEVNFLFGKTYIEDNSRNYWSGGIRLEGWGDDVFAAATKKQKENYNFLLPELSSRETTISKEKFINEKGEETEESVLAVELSSSIATSHSLKKGDYFFFELPTWANYGEKNLRIRAKVANIQKTETFLNMVYLDKDDLLQVIENTVDENIERIEKQIQSVTGPSEERKVFNGSENQENKIGKDELVKDKEDLIIFKKEVDVINKDVKADVDGYRLNNSMYSKEMIPANIKYLTLPIFNNTMIKKNGTAEEPQYYTKAGSSILDYWHNQKTVKNFKSLSNGLTIFDLITKKIQEKMSTYIRVIDKFIKLLIVITITISIIIIMLVLFENKTIIVLFKAMGYRSKEVNWYLAAGYITAAILALTTGFIVAGWIINIVSPIILDATQVALFYIWSWKFLVTGIALLLVFAVMIITSIMIYTRKQHSKDAFIPI